MADAFTPEQIAQILEEFFKTVGTRQYIGARYVPLFGRKDEESIIWDNSAPYEPLTIVLYQGNSYTSRQYVPEGVEITNEEFWAITGNYNAQIEEYRRVAQSALNAAQVAQGDIDTLLPKTAFSAENTVKDSIDGVQLDIDTLLPKADFSSENTVKDYIDGTVQNVQNDIDTLLPKADFSSENTVKKYVDDINTSINEKILTVCKPNYLGRIVTEQYAYSNPQGMCIINDTVGLFSISDSTTTNNCIIIKVDITTGNVIDTYDTNFAHCNGLCYNDDNNYVYVCPANDYTGENVVGVNYIYKVNVNTMRVVETITLPFRPHSICFDKITKKMYIMNVEYQQNTFTLYAFDYNDNSFELLSTFDTSTLRDKFSYLNVAIGGYQQLAAYNDDIYYVMGSAGCNYLIRFNASYEPVNVTNINTQCYIYRLTELEGIDFLYNGNCIFYSKASVLGGSYYAVIGTLNIYGKSIDNSATLLTPIGHNTCYLNGSTVDTNIYLTGFDEESAFTTFIEAYAAVVCGLSTGIRVDSDITINHAPRLTHNCLIDGRGVTITVTTTIVVLANIRIIGVANSKCTIKVPSTFASNYIFDNYGCAFILEYVTMNLEERTGHNYFMRNYGHVIIDSCDAILNASLSGQQVQCAHIGTVVSYSNENIAINQAASLYAG